MSSELKERQEFAEKGNEAGGAALRAIMLSRSAIGDDPRVRRMGDFLTSRGWDVLAIGLPGARSEPPAWPILEVHPLSDSCARLEQKPDPNVFWSHAIWPARFFAAGGVYLLGLGTSAFDADKAAKLSRLSQVLCRRGAGRFNPFKSFARPVRKPKNASEAEGMLLSSSPDIRAIQAAAMESGHVALWIANDWVMLPIAAKAAARFGGAYVYDSHEYATHEYAERREWRLYQRPIVRAIEREYVSGAAVVTTVSPGITEALKRLYRLHAPTGTLRNVPYYQAVPFRPCGERIRVLYHGVVAPGRGLEASVRSVRDWPANFQFTIRGPGEAAYLAYLNRLAEEAAVGGRVTIAPPIPTATLVKAASEHDIGLLAAPCHSQHNALSLPNKLFEYLMAGLALCLSRLPAMASIAEQSGAGIICGSGTEAEIAAAMHSLTPDKINEMKRHALEAAKSLHFEADAAPVERLYTDALMRALPSSV